MAKRRKLNKKAIVLLVFLGVLLVFGGGSLVVKRWLPKDPLPHENKGDEAFKNSNYALADQSYTAAAVIDNKEPRYYYKLGSVHYDWALKAPNLPQTERNDHFSRSIGYLRTALRLDPKNLEAQRKLTDIYWNTSLSVPSYRVDTMEQEKALIELLAQGDQKDPEVQKELAKCYYRRGYMEALQAQTLPAQYGKQAVEDLAKAVQLQKTEVTYWSEYASALNDFGKDKEKGAIKAYEEAIAILPDSPELRVSYADLLKSTNKPQESLKQIEEAIKRAPKSTVGLIALSQYFKAEQKYDLAMKPLEQAKGINKSDYIIYTNMADIYTRQRDNDKAIAAIREGIASLEEKLATQLSDVDRRQMQLSKLNLNFQLANLLMELVDKGQGDKDKLVAEARQNLDLLQKDLPKDSPYTAKIAGRIAMAQQNIPEAIKYMEIAYGSNGYDLQAAISLIHLYQQSGMPGKGEKILSDLSKIPGLQNNPIILIAQANFQFMYKNYEEAQKLLDKALKITPDNPEGLRLKSLLALARGQQKTLPKELVNERTTQYIIQNALIMWDNNQRRDAIGLLEDALSKSPNNLLFISQLVPMYITEGDRPAAEKLLKQAKAANPDNPNIDDYLKILNEKDMEKVYQMRLGIAERINDPLMRALEKASIANSQQKKEDYLKFIAEAAKVNPDSPLVIDRQLSMAIANKDWPAADDCIKRAEKADLDRAKGRLYAAQLAIARQQWDSAREKLTQVCNEQPDNKRASLMLGEVCLQTDKIDQAEELFNQIIKNDPSFAPAVIGMARVTEVKNTSDRIKWLERAYRLAPQNAYVQQRYIELQAEEGSKEDIVDKIIPRCEKMLQANPNDVQNRLRLANLYEKVGQNDRAEQIYLTLYKNNSNSVQAVGLLADFYGRTDQSMKAQKVINDFLKNTNDKVAGYVMYGNFLTKFNVDQARAAYDKAIAADSNNPRGHLAKSRFEAYQSNWPQAIASLEKYLQMQPDDRANQRELVRYYIEAGKVETANKMLDKILTQDPSDVVALTLKGFCALKEGQVAKADELLKKAMKDSQNPEAFLYHSQLARTQGDFMTARNDLETAGKISDDPQIQMELARVMVAMRDLDGAELVYREVLNKHKDNSAATKALLALYLERQQWNQLQTSLDAAKKLYPNDAFYYQIEKQMWTTRGDPVKAERAMSVAVSIAPSPASVREYLQTLLEAGQYDKILTVAQQHQGQDGYATWIGSYNAAAAFRKGQTAQAEQLFVESIKAMRSEEMDLLKEVLQTTYGSPKAAQNLHRWADQCRSNDPAAYITLMGMYIADRANNSAEALIPKLSQVCVEPRHKSQSARLVALIYYQNDNFEKARQAYLEAIANDAKDVQTLNNLAYMLVEDLKQPQEGLKYAEQASKLEPNNGYILDTYGWALACCSKFDEAENVLNKSILATPSLSASHYHLGRLYEMRKRNVEALKEYKKALEVAPAQDPMRKEITNSINSLKKNTGVKE